jgi:hypothetical protein
MTSPMPKLVKFECLPCPSCLKVKTFTLAEVDIIRWKGGMKIQHAFPYLTASEREQMMTGYCSDCWDELWKDKG